MAETPVAEIDIDVTLVAELLADQHLDLAGRRLRPLAHGCDNESFRLGDDLVAVLRADICRLTRTVRPPPPGSRSPCRQTPGLPALSWDRFSVPSGG